MCALSSQSVDVEHSWERVGCWLGLLSAAEAALYRLMEHPTQLAGHPLVGAHHRVCHSWTVLFLGIFLTDLIGRPSGKIGQVSL